MFNNIRWMIRSALSKSVKIMIVLFLAGYEGYSETERVLVCNDELATLNMLKIQSDQLGNLLDTSGDEINDGFSLSKR